MEPSMTQSNPYGIGWVGCERLALLLVTGGFGGGGTGAQALRAPAISTAAAVGFSMQHAML